MSLSPCVSPRAAARVTAALTLAALIAPAHAPVNAATLAASATATAATTATATATATTVTAVPVAPAAVSPTGSTEAGAVAEDLTADWQSAPIVPGQTLELKPENRSGAQLRVDTADPTALPAGWSVLSRQDGVRLVAPRTAAEGDFVKVQIRRDGNQIGEVRVIVEAANNAAESSETVGAEGVAGGASSSSGPRSWFDRLAAFWS